jgi:cyclophilin family peptidyl-prolyl cis-trans isomerase
MANSGAGTTGSQFFVVTGANALPPDFSTLGTITKGMKVADELASFANPNENAADPTTQTPTRPLYLFTVTIREAPATPESTTTTAGATPTTAPAAPPS